MSTVCFLLTALVCFARLSSSVFQASGAAGNSKPDASVLSHLVRSETQKPKQAPIAHHSIQRRLQHNVKDETDSDYWKANQLGVLGIRGADAAGLGSIELRRQTHTAERKVPTFDRIEKDLSLMGQTFRRAVKEVVDDLSVGVQAVENLSNTSAHAQSSNLPASELEGIKEATGFKVLCKHDKLNKSLAKFADKAGVKDYIRSLNVEVSVPETLLLVKHESEITMDKFENLPSRFVMKATHGSSMTVVVNGDSYSCVATFCAASRHPESNEKTDRLKFLRDSCATWLGIDFGAFSHEAYYSQITPKCIFEEFIENNDDWKIHTFHGTPIVLQVDTGRFHDHRQSYYTPSWHKLSITNYKGKLPTWDVPKPDQLSSLLKAASVLASGLSHVRVDLYFSGNKVYFSELTHTPQGCGGGWRPSIVDKYFGYILANQDARRLPDDISQLLNCETCSEVPKRVQLLNCETCSDEDDEDVFIDD